MRDFYIHPEEKLPVKEYDVVVAGAGTGGVMAAIAASRQGAKTALIELKGYAGGTAVDGGTALHSFYNLARGTDQPLRQLVRGLPEEFVNRLITERGCTGHAPMEIGFDYDEVCTSIDVEIYKLLAAEMLEEEGVHVYYNTMVCGGERKGSLLNGVIAQSRSGREYFAAKSFIDCTGYGDLCAYAGADFTEPNDHAVANSIGVAGVSVEGYYNFLKEHNAVNALAYAGRDGKEYQMIRVSGGRGSLPEEYLDEIEKIGMHTVITTTHDNYFMFLKLNKMLPVSPTDRDAVSSAEVELRRRQKRAVDLLRRYVPGCENAFIARSAPSLSIRRGRCIVCDYDITIDDITSGRHFDDDIMAYGFHDCAPRIKVGGNGSYGLPYRALLVHGLDNVFATGMMISSNWDVHMSTRNTVCCMGQGEAAGTAAALSAKNGVTPRELPYAALREALIGGGVYLEN